MKPQVNRDKISSKYQPFTHNMESEYIFMDDLPQQIWYMTSPMEYGRVNKAHANFLGGEVADVSHKSIYDVLSEMDADECCRNNQKVFESKETLHFDQWLVGADLSPKHFSINILPKLNATGDVACLLCTAHDITNLEIQAQKQTEEQLKILKQNYKLVFENTSNVFVTLNQKGLLLHLIKPQTDFLGYGSEDLMGISLEQFVPLPELDNIWTKFKQSVNNIVVEKFESILLHKNGREVFVEIVPKKFEYLGQNAIHCTITDISARKKAEENEKLTSAFLVNMSHEIRTPLNSIIGFASILHDEMGLVMEDVKCYARIINSSGKHLLKVINDIIHISKLDCGHIKPMYEPTSIKLLLQDLYQIYYKQIQDAQKPILLSLDIPDDTMLVSTDATKLRQILENLLGNALKFTAQGNIHFGYCIKDNCIEFFVRDTGVGIEEEQQKIIFNRFAQASVNTEKLYGGSGLGLSINKALTQLLGGDIWVQSKPNEGCAFYFTINYTPYSNKKIVRKVEM